MNPLKKILFSSMAALYLLLSIGVYIDAHYCHGDLASVTYFSQNSDCECGSMEEMTCCFNLEEYVKIDEKAVVAEDFNFSPVEVQPLFEWESEIEEKIESVDETYAIEFDTQPKYILYRSLVLYA